MPEHKADLKRLTHLTAAPLEAVKVPKGAVAPDPSDDPMEGVEVYDHIVKPPKEHQTIADRLNYLCDALGGARHYRQPTDKGVILKVKLPDNQTVIAGMGETTAEAFNDLLAKTLVLTGQTTAKKGGK